MKHCFTKISDTIKAYKDGLDYGHSNGRAVWFEHGKLYSCFSDDPIVIRMSPKRNQNVKKGEEWYLVNADRNEPRGLFGGPTHLFQTYSIFHEHPRISFSAAQAAGIFETIDERRINLIDFTPDIYDSVDRKDNEFDNFENNFPPGTEISYERENGEIVLKRAHRVGTVVLSDEQKGYFLCAMDESQYFISKLHRKVTSVDDAFAAMTPKEILQAREQRIPVQRQGEWFFFRYSDYDFLPKYLKQKISSTLIKEYKETNLPKKDTRGNDHILTRGIIVKNKFAVGWGTLRHSARTHRMLRLPRKGGEQPWVGIINRTQADWSVEGRRVD